MIEDKENGIDENFQKEADVSEDDHLDVSFNDDENFHDKIINKNKYFVKNQHHNYKISWFILPTLLFIVAIFGVFNLTIFGISIDDVIFTFLFGFAKYLVYAVVILFCLFTIFSYKWKISRRTKVLVWLLFLTLITSASSMVLNYNFFHKKYNFFDPNIIMKSLNSYVEGWYQASIFSSSHLWHSDFQYNSSILLGGGCVGLLFAGIASMITIPGGFIVTILLFVYILLALMKWNKKIFFIFKKRKLTTSTENSNVDDIVLDNNLDISFDSKPVVDSLSTKEDKINLDEAVDKKTNLKSELISKEIESKVIHKNDNQINNDENKVDDLMNNSIDNDNEFDDELDMAFPSIDSDDYLNEMKDLSGISSKSHLDVPKKDIIDIIKNLNEYSELNENSYQIEPDSSNTDDTYIDNDNLLSDSDSSEIESNVDNNQIDVIEDISPINTNLRPHGNNYNYSLSDKETSIENNQNSDDAFVENNDDLDSQTNQSDLKNLESLDLENNNDSESSNDELDDSAAYKFCEENDEDINYDDEDLDSESAYASSEINNFIKSDMINYKLPNILNFKTDNNNSEINSINWSNAKIQADNIKLILKHFNVEASIQSINVGPQVTKLEIIPEPGTKVSKILSLENDFKLAIANHNLRIEAPIPNKHSIGLEIPNKKIMNISFESAITNLQKTNHNKKNIIGLGKTVDNSFYYISVNELPHLLIAGTTGSGKSICIKNIIASLIMNADPKDLRLLLIDPKLVELRIFSKLPHLFCPIINDHKKAIRSLKLIIKEMEYRYNLFAKKSVNDIESYNNKFADNKLARIIIIIDELADLILMSRNEIEQNVMRITQMARAAGIHLIVATQRPSTDVITGIIKNNIPSRISFSVSSNVDSRTILDKSGAEKLLGKGDMLFSGPGINELIRIQGVFISDQEIDKLVNHWSSQEKNKFNPEIIDYLNTDTKSYLNPNDKIDPLYNEVKKFVLNVRRASTSLIQKQFSIGYIRASKIIDILEMNKIIGPHNNAKPREIF